MPLGSDERTLRLWVFCHRLFLSPLYTAKTRRAATHGAVDRQSTYVGEPITPGHAKDLERSLASGRWTIRSGRGSGSAPRNLAFKPHARGQADAGIWRNSHSLFCVFDSQAGGNEDRKSTR